jgi:hypothetical protein
MDWHDDALWQPWINLTYMADFLSLLVPTARKLGLDIYTRTHGIYLPAAGMAVPTQEGSRFRLTYDPEVATPSLCNFPNKQAQQDALLASFKQVLAPHGFEAGADFVHPFFILRRQVEEGEQLVMALFHAFGCDFLLQTKSMRFAVLNQTLAPDETDDLGLFNVWFGGVRNHVNPAWKNLNNSERFYIRNQEEVDWLLFDLVQQGLLILDKARTIKGMDWLYNSAAGAKLLPVNTNSINETLAAVAYAYWAGNPDFDNIIEKLRGQLQENQDIEDSECFEVLVNYCRTELQPMGDGVA